MNPEEKQQILTLRQKLSGPVKIRLLRSKDERGGDLEKFCDRLTELIPDIHIRKEDAGTNEIPSILITERLKFCAVPMGTEIGPFIRALIGLGSNGLSLPIPLTDKLAAVTLPALLEVYVTPNCPYCPQIVQELLPLSQVGQLVNLVVIDSMLFPELAAKNKIKAVPTLILDGQFRWTGSTQLEEIIDVMATRDPRSLGATSLEMMVKEGHAEQLAAMMLDAGEIFSAFYDLVAHRDWSVRLGAMVVMEYLNSKDSILAAQAVLPLWDRFQQMSDQAKGDTLYIFGEIGHPQVVPMLEKVLKNPYAREVKEAAAEALEKIRSSKSA